jgi:hypothetical protein
MINERDRHIWRRALAQAPPFAVHNRRRPAAGSSGPDRGTPGASLLGSAAATPPKITQAIQATRFEAIAEATTEVVAMIDAARPMDNERFDLLQ